jgi:hypothetical protein
METNILKYYGFLTRDEFEKYSCYKIVLDRYEKAPLGEKEFELIPKWKIETVPNTYPKTLVQAKIELRCRGLDAGDEDYGLIRVLEDGDVTPRRGMWSRDDIDVAMISLAELGCIERWIHVCKGYNIKPAKYAETMRTAIEQNVARIGQDVDSTLYYNIGIFPGKTMQEPSNVTITLRDDIDEVLHAIASKDDGDAQKES